MVQRKCKSRYIPRFVPQIDIKLIKILKNMVAVDLYYRLQWHTPLVAYLPMITAFLVDYHYCDKYSTAQVCR